MPHERTHGRSDGRSHRDREAVGRLMTTPRPHLRLVDGTRRDEDGELEFDAVERDAHDLHPPYHELGVIVADETREDDLQEPPRTALSPRFAIVALIAFQLLAALGYASKYIDLARGGDVFAVAAVLTVPASLCLYAGALLLALRPGRGRALFIVAAVGLGLSLPAWGVSYGWSWPMAFGAMLALAGAWFARAEVRPDEASAAQP